jgi:putative nucleotidyltransferase with HDIG domain
VKAAVLHRAIREFAESGDLPVFPELSARIAAITDDLNASVQDLAALVLQDQILTGKVLSVANTPFYGIGQQVSTVTKAVLVLGFTAIRNIVLVVSVTDGLARRFAGRDLADIWVHSLGCGAAARLLADRAGVDPERAMIAGLLHDVGRLFLHLRFPDECREIDAAVAAGTPFLEAERVLLGISHQEVGAELLAAWRLPEVFVAVAGGHHVPEVASDPFARERKLIHLADAIASRALGRPGLPDRERRGGRIDVLGFAEKAFAIPAAEVQAVAAELSRHVREIARALAMPIDPADLPSPAVPGPPPEALDPAKVAEKMARQLALLHEISTLAVDEAARVDQVLQAILEGIYRGIGFDRVFLFVLERPPRALAAKMGLGRDAPEVARGLRVPLDEGGLLAEVVATGRSFNVLDADSLLYGATPPLEVRGRLGVDAFAVTPLAVGAEVVGCVLADNVASRQVIADQDLASMRTFANLANLTLRFGRARK